ncbi:hypothetical protein HMPREF1214_04161 [Bacteroides sp. HPS0048]|uniref:hypothetical protein n=1 Tax=Bacteroides sp. HPS0048 TaxID=1078089 RepID=UPI000362CF54|nr:hypothetical protein [Bacteroides sp. HPS0048]EOA54335.1 hypothetical protein HMPREF1214_04161 [Bacteroides sp. HPS0048]
MGNGQLDKDKSLISEFYQLYNVKRLPLRDVLSKMSKKYSLDGDYIYRRIFNIEENQDYYNSLTQLKIEKATPVNTYPITEQKTFEQLQEESPEKLAKMQEQNPSRFNSIFNAYLSKNQSKVNH